MSIVGRQFVSKETLAIEFLVVSHVVEDNFLVMNFKKIRDYLGSSVSVLAGSEVLSKNAIEKDYIEFDSPAYHQAMKILEKSALG